MLAWIALSLVAEGIFSSRLGDVIYDWLLDVPDKWPLRLPLPIPVSDLAGVWWMSLILFAFVWFQPLLLRLDSKRTCAWIAVFTVSPIIGAMAHPEGLDGFIALFPRIVGTLAAITPTLLLIGQRTRPWLGFIAGFAHVLGLLAASAYAFGLLGGSENWEGVLGEAAYIIASEGIPPPLPGRTSDASMPGLMPMEVVNGVPMEVVSAVLPGLLVMMVGNVLFGVPLIFGTKPIGAELAPTSRFGGADAS